MSAIPSLQIVVEFLLAHCRVYLLAFFFCALYQENEVWDLMGSCLIKFPLFSSDTVFNLGERSLLPLTAVPSPWGMTEEESQKSGHAHTSLGRSDS